MIARLMCVEVKGEGFVISPVFLSLQLRADVKTPTTRKEMKQEKVLITNKDEVVVHANDNYQELPRKVVEQIKLISKDKFLYYFAQVGIANSFHGVLLSLSA